MMFKNGCYHGLYEEYHENGKLKARVMFENGPEVVINLMQKVKK